MRKVVERGNEERIAESGGVGRVQTWTVRLDSYVRIMEAMREFEIVLEMVEPGSRVLDLGCDDGELLTLLADRRGCRGTGIDIDLEQVNEVGDDRCDQGIRTDEETMSFSATYLEHFKKPRNVGEMDDPDAFGEARVERVSYEVNFALRVREGRIVASRFRARGCSAAIASASALTEMIEGKTMDQAEAIDIEALTDYLETVPVSKIECCVLALDALQAALADYRRRNPSVAN